MGTFNVLKAANKINIKHLIIGSSSSVYGANKKFPFQRLEKFIEIKGEIRGEVEGRKKNLYKKIHIEEIKDLNQFNIFYTNIEKIIFEKKINFIFLDDIASLIETEF